MHPTRLVEKRYEISSAATIPVFQIEVTKEVIRDMVGITARVGGAYWTYHLLAHICVKTSYVFLEESQYCITAPPPRCDHFTCNDVSVNPILPQNGQVKDWMCSAPSELSPPKKSSVSPLVRMACMGWLAECRGVEAPASQHALQRS